MIKTLYSRVSGIRSPREIAGESRVAKNDESLDTAKPELWSLPGAVCRLWRQRRLGRAGPGAFGTFFRRGRGIPPLRRRPRGFAPWTPTTFEKVDETFILRFAPVIQPSIHMGNVSFKKSQSWWLISYLVITASNWSRYGLSVVLREDASLLKRSTDSVLSFTGRIVPAPATQPPGQPIPSSR